ncbi:MAG: biotin transporter BioY [Fusobacteria bacterium]|nr:biotin transporter BioY [Fusobacteriota bacterium]
MQISLRVEDMIESQKNGLQKMTFSVLLVILGVLIYALSARVYFYLPFTPVPITGQTLVVFLLSPLYGRRLATVSIMSYIGLGIIGLPMFVGISGIHILFSPTFGYLIGMCVAACFMGEISSKGLLKDNFYSFNVLLCSTAVIYICGILWLGFFVGYSLQLILIGVVPFILGDSIKIFLAYGLLTPLKKVMYK